VNCEEWICTDLAANLLGITSVPLYETLGTQALSMILAQTEMANVFGSDKCLKNVLKSRPSENSHLRNFVVFDKASDELLADCQTFNIKVYCIHELMAKEES